MRSYGDAKLEKLNKVQ